MIANISTDYISKKKVNISSLMRLLEKSMIESANNYKYPNQQIRQEIIWALDSITNDFEKFSSTLSQIEYNHPTIDEIRSDEYLESIINVIIREYNLEISDYKVFSNILNKAFSIYEQKVLNTFLRKSDSKILYRQLLRLKDSQITKQDIYDLKEIIGSLILNLKKKSDIQISSIFIDELSKIEHSEIASSITHEYELMGKIVNHLTEEQMSVLNFQRHSNRMLIKGCAGSGKTILASEKAIRLSDAGFKTLVLCYSSLLCNHIDRLVSNSDVHVYTIIGLLKKILGKKLKGYEKENELDKQIYYDVGNIELAVDTILDQRIYFDAILVDEGQDFSENWWILIEALLENSESDILHVFADDNQNLYNPKKLYPVKESHFNLSKNIRNAGSVFKVIQQLHPSPPIVNNNLRDFGDVRLFKTFNITQGVLDAVSVLLKEGYKSDDIVILSKQDNFINFYLNFDETIFNKSIISSIRKHLSDVNRYYKLGYRKFPLDNNPKSESNIEFINSIFRHFKSSSFSDAIIKEDYPLPVWMSQELYDYSTVFDLKWEEPYNARYIKEKRLVNYYLKADWLSNLPQYFDLPKVPIKSLYSFKGLESDHVILIDSDLDFTELYVGVSRGVFSLYIISASDSKINWNDYGKLEFIKSMYGNHYRMIK